MQADFIECHLQDNKVSCSFSAGGGTLRLTSSASYSDGKWHTVSPANWVICLIIHSVITTKGYQMLGNETLFGNTTAVRASRFYSLILSIHFSLLIFAISGAAYANRSQWDTLRR